MATIELVKAKNQVAPNVIVWNNTVFSVEHVGWSGAVIAIRARKAGTASVWTIDFDPDTEIQTLVV